MFKMYVETHIGNGRPTGNMEIIGLSDPRRVSFEFFNVDKGLWLDVGMVANQEEANREFKRMIERDEFGFTHWAY